MPTPALLVMHPGLEDRLFDPVARRRLGCVVDLVSDTAVGDLAGLVELDRLEGVEVLVTGWGCPSLDAEVLDQLPSLRFMAHAAGTVRGIVTDVLWERGITVTSAAAANAVPVAEFTFAAIVMLGKDVFGIRDRHRQARGTAGAVDHASVGNRGLRVGIIGASTIGRLVIERLRTLDVEVLVADPYLDDAEATDLGAARVELDDLLATSDVVSVHAPALPSTHHLLNVAALARMRDGAWLLNTARGSLVDTAALQAEVLSGRLSAFIDTSDPEPLPPESPLYDLPNVVLTPHIAGSLGNEVGRMGELAVTEVERYVAGEVPLHPVNRADLDRIA
ncbi:MAG: hydroxyacid dehydrogenase [Acidimicrobiales bacterium]|nr:hydroxyacid dehydrogenase [Acidimicrobiales bacterium]